MSRIRGGLRAERGRDVMELLAMARPASLDPPAEPPSRCRDIAAAIGSLPGQNGGGESLPVPPRRRVRRGVLAIGAPLTAAAAAVVAAVFLASFPGGPVPRAAPAPSDSPSRMRLTGRQILLTAATHVVSAPATGKYWRTREISGELLPAGTKANPYDNFLPVSYDQWTARSAGQRDWSVYQTQGAVPATPADAAAWRAAGSPASWTYPFGTITAAASPPGATWQLSDGTVGYVEGDERGLTAAQFRAMPAAPARLLARLRHFAMLTCAGTKGCVTVDQLVWSEAVNLLQDPVTSQVRAAAYRVMAALPGVRLLGKMTDPIGRSGYGFGTGRSTGASIAVIDPQTGSLLVTETVGHAARTAGCPERAGLHGRGLGPPGRCNGPLYYGRSYRGQVSGYEVLVSEGWTDVSPVLPPRTAWLGPNGQKS